jgi:hypothetical protein
MRSYKRTRAFDASCARLAAPGSRERRAVIAIVLELLEDGRHLPGAKDQEVVIAPSLRCMARPIPSARLLVCYSVKKQIVTLLGVMESAGEGWWDEK